MTGRSIFQNNLLILTELCHVLFYGFKRFIAYRMFDATCIVGSSFFLYPEIDDKTSEDSMSFVNPRRNFLPCFCEFDKAGVIYCNTALSFEDVHGAAYGWS